MNDSPLITSILTAPGLGTSEDKAFSNPRASQTLGAASPADLDTPFSGEEMISVGLVLDGERVAWGDCVAATDMGKSEYATPFPAADGVAVVQKIIAPLLQGQPLIGFRQPAASVEKLKETVTVTRTLPQPEPADERSQPEASDERNRRFSRRDLFTGQLWSDEEAGDTSPRTEEVTVERPIHPAIRYGVSQALLAATAMARNLTMAEVVTHEYDLPSPATAVPVHAEVGSLWPQAAEAGIRCRVASLGYTIAGDEVEEELGRSGEILQRQVRQLRERIAGLTVDSAGQPYQPAIRVNARGGFGTLYQHDAGKILGSLYGLEQAAKPCLLRVVDPVVMDSRQAQIETMLQLKKYVRLRRLSLQLVADSWIRSPDDVSTFLQAEAADVIHLNMARLGGLSQTIEAVLACREQGVAVMLEGSPAESRFAAHVALATQPHLIVARLDRGGIGLSSILNEMSRTLVWLAARAKS